MTIELELSQEMERKLSAEAASFGLSLPEYIERLLTTGRPVSKMPTTGTDLVSYWRSEGIVGSRTDINDGRKRAQQLRSQSERRLRE